MHEVDKIRAEFPGPIVSNLDCEGYCVLGAAILYTRSVPDWPGWQPLYRDRFPYPVEAEREIGISAGEAEAIIEANDAGDFEAAWRLLREAWDARIV